MRNELELQRRASAVRTLVSSLEHDGHDLANGGSDASAFLAGFMPRVAGVKPVVAFDACPADSMVSELVAAGVGFSIRSVEQLDEVCALGVDPRSISFRSLDSARDGVRDAALRGVWRFAIRSESELSDVAAAAPGAAVYVRVDVQRMLVSPKEPSRGTSAYDALRLLQSAPEVGLRPYGLAFNVASVSGDAVTYARAIDRCGLVMRRLEQLGSRIEMLSMGGGFGPDPSDPALIAAVGRLPYRPSLLVAEP